MFLCFHYTGKLNVFDKLIYYGNVAAGVLAPAIFLHFSFTFPEPRKWFGTRAGVALLYAPAALLFAAYLALSSGMLKLAMSPVETQWLIDRVWILFATAPYIAGGLVFNWEHLKSRRPDRAAAA